MLNVLWFSFVSMLEIIIGRPSLIIYTGGKFIFSKHISFDISFDISAQFSHGIHFNV